jgi:hypothetical protein
MASPNLNAPGMRVAANYLLNMTKGEQQSKIVRAIAAEIETDFRRTDAVAQNGVPDPLAVPRAWCGGAWALAGREYAKEHVLALRRHYKFAVVANQAILLAPVGAVALFQELRRQGERPDQDPA